MDLSDEFRNEVVYVQCVSGGESFGEHSRFVERHWNKDLKLGLLSWVIFLASDSRPGAEILETVEAEAVKALKCWIFALFHGLWTSN